MNKNDREFIAQKIRIQYTVKEDTKLDELKRLDSKVKIPANVFAYVFGSISALVMGSGMSLVMTDISETVGVANPMLSGIALICLAYPIYNRTLKTERERIAPEIIRLTDEMMGL